jgi:hypothetical protein
MLPTTLPKVLTTCCAALALFAATTTSAQIRYVDDDAPAGGNGQNWPTAYRHLQDALAEAAEDVSITEIRVAAGLYRPDQAEVAPITPGDRNATFALRSALALHGGYAGNTSEDPSYRDTRQYPTVLTGDLAGNDGPNFAGNGENTLHVVTLYNVDSTGVLDGLTITGGNANLTNPGGIGGGIYIESGGPTVQACKIVGNAANTFAGGVYALESDPSFTNCLIAANKSALTGGGVHNFNSTTLFTQCTFTANQAVLGGALYNSGPAPFEFAGCVLWGNTADTLGGGGNVTISNSDVQGGFGGPGNINADPLFVSSINHDYRLVSVSPAVDAIASGMSATDLDGHARPMCGSSDMGAYEYGAADQNCDGTINLADYAAWTGCMTGPDQGPYPAGCQAFDYPQDGDVDLRDFARLQQDLKGS